MKANAEELESRFEGSDALDRPVNLKDIPLPAPRGLDPHTVQNMRAVHEISKTVRRQKKPRLRLRSVKIRSVKKLLHEECTYADRADNASRSGSKEVARRRVRDRRVGYSPNERGGKKVARRLVRDRRVENSPNELESVAENKSMLVSSDVDPLGLDTRAFVWTFHDGRVTQVVEHIDVSAAREAASKNDEANSGDLR